MNDALKYPFDPEFAKLPPLPPHLIKYVDKPWWHEEFGKYCAIPEVRQWMDRQDDPRLQQQAESSRQSLTCNRKSAGTIVVRHFEAYNIDLINQVYAEARRDLWAFWRYNVWECGETGISPPPSPSDEKIALFAERRLWGFSDWMINNQSPSSSLSDLGSTPS